MKKLNSFAIACWITAIVEIVMIGLIGYAYFYGDSKLCGDTCIQELYYGR